MTATPSDETLVSHALRVAGWLGPDRLPAWGVTEPQPTLDALTEAGTARLVRSPRGEMYGLTPEGTERAKTALAEWSATLDAAARAALPRTLAGFESHDGALKRLVSDYQGGQRDTVAERLRAFHEEAHPDLAAVAATTLWASYPTRLANALSRVEKQEFDWVASPLLESYHTVWHLAHRDMRLVCAELPA